MKKYIMTGLVSALLFLALKQDAFLTFWILISMIIVWFGSEVFFDNK